MPLTAVENGTPGVVTLTSGWTGQEFMDEVIPNNYYRPTTTRTVLNNPYWDPGRTQITTAVSRWNFLDGGTMTLQNVLIRVYPSNTATAENVAVGLPYFGTVAQNIYTGQHGPIITASVNIPEVVRTRSVATGSNGNNTPTAGAVFDLVVVCQPGGFSFTANGVSHSVSSRFFSDYICNGSWVVDIRETYLLRIQDTGTTLFERRGSSYLPDTTGRAQRFILREETLVSVRRVELNVARRACPNSVPLPPNVIATAQVDGTVNVSWTAAGGGTADYWEISLDNSRWTRVIGTSYTQTGLTPLTSYTFYVRGANATGRGLVGTATVRTARAPLASIPAPTVTHSNIEQTQATISWQHTGAGINVEEWQISTDGTTWMRAAGNVPNGTFLLDDLTPGSGYIVYVRGTDPARRGAPIGIPGSTSFTTKPLVLVPETPIVPEERMETTGGGTTSTSDQLPSVVVTGERPVVQWDKSLYTVPALNIYEGAVLPTARDGRLYADEWEPLPLRWSYYSDAQRNQASVRVRQAVYGTDGRKLSGSDRSLQLIGTTATFTPTATRAVTELNELMVAGNTANARPGNIGVPPGWGSTQDGDSIGYSRLNFRLDATDDNSPAQTSLINLLDIIPYEGLRLSNIFTYNAGANILGFQCNYYARGLTTNLEARNNEVAFYKWAIYRRDAPEEARPVAGTIREAGQTVYATGAHWVPTGWQVGYRMYGWQNPNGPGQVNRIANRNPGGTILRIAFPGSQTQGLIPNGNYTIRLRVIDIYGNQVGPVSYDFSVNRPGGSTTPVSTTLPPGADAQTIAVVPSPRVYTAAGTLTTTANTGLASVTSGLIPGQSIGLSVNVVGTVPNRADLVDVIGSEGDVVNFLVIQRREYARESGLDVDSTPRLVSGRIFINQIAGSAGAYYPTFRAVSTDGGVEAIFFDYQLESDVEYQYRCVWINKFSNRTYSTWVPA